MSPTEDGDYRLCFDNSFSKLYEKIVFFGVIMTPNSQSGTSRGQDEWVDMVMTENTVEYQLEDIRVSGETQKKKNLVSVCFHLLLPCSSFRPPPGEDGLCVPATGEEPSGPDLAAGL